MSGFSVFEQTGIVLAVGDARSVNVTLKVGALTETVSVRADATLVETRSVGVGTVVSQEQIVGLPLNGRSATQLVVLAGGAVEVGGLTDNRQYPNAVSISVAGGTGNSTMYLVDGGYNNDPQNNTGNAMPFPDALQEFNVESGVRSARFGMSTGATVNAVTRSGTNAFHGGMFGFGRHHTFNAIRYFERTENGGLGRDDGLKRSQIGGTFGGPLIKDKLFFFAGTQVTNTRIAPMAGDQFVPTAEVRRGDFRRIMSAACRGGTARTLGAPFVDNQIDPALYHPISLQIMTMLPIPDPALDPDGCGRYVLAIPNDSDEQQYIGRVDYQVTTNHRVFGRYFYTKYLHAPLFNINTNPNLLMASGNGGGNDARMQHVRRRLGLRRLAEHGQRDALLVPAHGDAPASGRGRADLDEPRREHVPVHPGQRPGLPAQRHGRVELQPADGRVLRLHAVAVAGLRLEQGRAQHLVRRRVDASALGRRRHVPVERPVHLQRPDHQRHRQRQRRPEHGRLGARPAVGLQPGRQPDQRPDHQLRRSVRGRRLARERPADPQLRRAVGAVHSRRRIRTTSSWRSIVERFDQGIKSEIYTNAPAGLVFPGDPGFPTNKANNDNDLNQFAPRFGFVWDPNGDARQTIRAGVGHYFDSPKLWQYAHHMLNAPYGNTTNAQPATSCGVPNRNGCPIVFADPWRFTPGGDPLAGRARAGRASAADSDRRQVPAAGRVREHADRRRADAGDAVGHVVRTAVPRAG